MGGDLKAEGRRDKFVIDAFSPKTVKDK